MRQSPDALKDVPPFSALAAPQRQAIAQLGTQRTYAKGESIWREGDQATALQFIVRGIMLVSRTDAAGDRTVVGVRGPGECPGETPVIEHRAYPADAEALSPEVVLLRLPLEVLGSGGELGAALDGVVRTALVQHIRVLRGTIDVLSERTVARRLALLFLRLGTRFGAPTTPGRIHLPVPLSRADLASLVGARIETTIRALSPWQRRRWLRTAPEGFEYDVAPLEALLSEG